MKKIFFIAIIMVFSMSLYSASIKILSPKDGAVISKINPTLIWKALGTKKLFKVRIYKMPEKSLVCVANVKRTMYKVESKILDYGNTYLWEVQGKSTVLSWKCNSEVFKFTIAKSSGSSTTSSSTSSSSDTIKGHVILGISCLRMHSDPSLKAQIIKKLSPGTKFTVIKSRGDWVKIELSSGLVGWVHKDYIAYDIGNVSNTSPSTQGNGVKPQEGIVNPGISGLRLRKGLSRKSKIIKVLPPRTHFSIIKSQGDWLNVKTDSGDIGWVHKGYVIIGGTSSPNNTTVNPLSSNPNISNSAMLKKLISTLQVSYVLEHKSSFFSSKYEDKEMKKVFTESKILSSQFSKELASKKMSKLEEAYKLLLECVFNPVLFKMVANDLKSGSYYKVWKRLRTKRDEIFAGKYTKEFIPQNGLSTIIINIPAQRLRVYRKGIKIYDDRCVVGQKNHPDLAGGKGNSKTRVGSTRIKKWYQNYSNATYPPWNKSKWKGAFGAWTAKFTNGSGEYIHGTVGGMSTSWFAIVTAPGSHGCIRNQNKNIVKIHKLCPKGSKVIVIYCLKEYKRKVYSRTSDYGDPEVVYDVDKLKNIYDYHCNKNAVFYPDTGIIMNYSHPKDAVRFRR